MLLDFFVEVGALDEELVLNYDFEDHYEPQASADLSIPRQTIKSGGGPQSVAAIAVNSDISQDCDYYTSDLCIDVDRYPRY